MDMDAAPAQLRGCGAREGQLGVLGGRVRARRRERDRARDRAGNRRADATRRAGDDGSVVVIYRQAFTWRVAAKVRPPASVTTARRSCFPAGTRPVAHEPEKTSAAPFRTISICFPSTRK